MWRRRSHRLGDEGNHFDSQGPEDRRRRSARSADTNARARAASEDCKRRVEVRYVLPRKRFRVFRQV